MKEYITKKELKELLEEAFEENTSVEIDIYGNIYGIRQANPYSILKTLVKLLGQENE